MAGYFLGIIRYLIVPLLIKYIFYYIKLKQTAFHTTVPKICIIEERFISNNNYIFTQIIYYMSVVSSERGATTLHIEHLAMSVAIKFIQLRNILDQHDTPGAPFVLTNTLQLRVNVE